MAVTAAMLALSACGTSTTASTAAPPQPAITTAMPDLPTSGPPTSAPVSAPAAKPSSVPSNGPPALRLVATLNEPIDLQVRKDDPRLFVAQRGGVIVTITNDRLDETPWLNIYPLLLAEGERGLLAFTFSPNGRQLFVHYSDRDGNTQIDRWDIDSSGQPQADSRTNVLSLNQPFANHNGGRIAFGPDEMLYVGLGDGGSTGDPGNRAQNLRELFGKLLRINPNPSTPGYQIPADNPFVGQGARGEIWSYGLRNPWRFSWDRATKELWIGDVGQNLWEEVDRSTSGRGVNYGWRAFEGTHEFNADTKAPNAERPLYEYSHEATGGCSVTGGVVYRGPTLLRLQGAYIYGDYCWPTLHALINGKDKDLGLAVGNVVSINEDADGEIYVLGFDGSVAKLVAK
jgi:glucose/arabinose dehydrogenase